MFGLLLAQFLKEMFLLVLVQFLFFLLLFGLAYK
jgi:hypothetical protein